MRTLKGTNYNRIINNNALSMESKIKKTGLIFSCLMLINVIAASPKSTQANELKTESEDSIALENGFVRVMKNASVNTAVDADVAFPANAPVNVVATTLALGKLTVVAFGAEMAVPVADTVKFLVARVFELGLKVRWFPTVSLEIAVFPTTLVI